MAKRDPVQRICIEFAILRTHPNTSTRFYNKDCQCGLCFEFCNIWRTVNSGHIGRNTLDHQIEINCGPIGQRTLTGQITRKLNSCIQGAHLDPALWKLQNNALATEYRKPPVNTFKFREWPIAVDARHRHAKYPIRWTGPTNQGLGGTTAIFPRTDRGVLKANLMPILQLRH